MDLLSLDIKLNKKKKKINDASIKKGLLEDSLIKKEKDLLVILAEKQQTMIARDLLEKSTQSARERGKEILEKSATEIVQMVFGKHYSIQIELDVKAGNPVADVYINKRIAMDTQQINVDNEGGGLRDIISLSFFIAISQLVGGDNGALITLDEPTPAVSQGHSEQTAEAISALMEYANKQSLIITHEREFLPNLIEHVYYVEQSADGVSKVEEL